jgi:hypothetical protein
MVTGIGDVIRVACRCQQALLAAPQVNDRRAAAAQQRSGERAVVAAGAVPQMDRRGVGSTAPDPGQAVETAPRPDRDDAGAAVAQHDI